MQPSSSKRSMHTSCSPGLPSASRGARSHIAGTVQTLDVASHHEGSPANCQALIHFNLREEATMEEVKSQMRKLMERNALRIAFTCIVSTAIQMQPVLASSYEKSVTTEPINTQDSLHARNLIDTPNNIPAWSPATLTTAELHALRSLCLIGLRANGAWGSERINIAITYLAFGSQWPDKPSATAYKVCSHAGSIHTSNQ